MKTHPLPSVDSQILYKRYQPLDGDAIMAVIVAVAEKVGVPRSACQLLNTSDDVNKRFLCGKFHVLVTQTGLFEHTPLIDAALETIYARTAFPEAADLLNEIAACTQISVRKSLIPTDSLPENLKTLSGVESLAFCEAAETLQAMEIARLITAIIVERSRPDAVFWAPSSFLLKPDAFSALARASNHDDLYLLPNPYGQQDPETGEQLIGMMGIGSQWLTGYRVEVLPCRLPPEYLAEILVAFSKFTNKSSRLIDDGDVFGREENEKIQVIYHEEDDDGLGTIELKVVHNPKFGILREDVPTKYVRYDEDLNETGSYSDGSEDTELDPHDPVDAAILERLQELKEEAPSQAPPDVRSEEAFEQEMSALDRPDQSAIPAYPETASAVSPSTASQVHQTIATAAGQLDDTRIAGKTSPSSKRMSVAELRDFVKQAQVSNETSEKAGKKPGFLAKLFKRKADQ
ncbi:hypothetical protein ACP90_17945 [Labrenzia sp. CP4]|uniref:hypothetical protein n=1 Tax=Labrenzia sp. CP4 TaxID=1674922 RepID=UPI00078252CD|nr:hypothetical protein [Labrenzia sp. CP4]AMN53991.1 hypothetical protein ACP90_17945 [Labrenzia sp. CP4]